MLYTHSRMLKTAARAVIVAVVLAGLLAIPRPAAAQRGLELAGGWTYITGNFGQNGFDFGAGWNFTSKVQVAADYDTCWKNSPVGTFQVTPVGQVTVHNHLQDWLFGPRIFFLTRQIKKQRVRFFGEAQFGWSHGSTEISSPTFATLSNSDTGFSWMLGGGGEYVFSQHWSVRGKIDLLRTHFANNGQSRARVGLGVTYTFANRER